MTQKLESLIDNYGDKKAELDALKKETDNINAIIKSLMLADNLIEVYTDKYKATYQTRKSESLDEEKVIDILKSNAVTGIIKSKEYVDENALEKAIYDGKLDSSIIQQINNARITKESVALMIKKV